MLATFLLVCGTMETMPSQISPKPFIVAIDGPAGAGKSTVAAHLAHRFGLLNLETGAMYRALALKALRIPADPDNAQEIFALTSRTSIRLERSENGNQVFLDGEDVTASLRAPEVTAAASRVSVHGPVREWMVAEQRGLALSSGRGVVMEGRDIGTVVFPEAPVKLFLDASVEARSDRRFSQQPAAPDAGSEARDQVLREMRDRDHRDRTRSESPLRPAEDAIVVETTALSLAEVLARVDQIVRERMA